MRREAIESILKRVKRVFPEGPLRQATAKAFLESFQAILFRTSFRSDPDPNEIITVNPARAKHSDRFPLQQIDRPGERLRHAPSIKVVGTVAAEGDYRA